MTNHDEDLPSAALTDTGPDQTLVVDRPLPADATGVICQAESVEIGLGQDGADPFDAIFLLAGTDPRGREVAVWIRLTPTTINDLTEQLTQVLSAQQQILGGNGFHRTTDDIDTHRTTADEDEDDPGEGRAKRFFDPMGIRHLKDRSPRSTVMLGVAIASLMLLAFVLQHLRG
jgi:hypothetical protein